MWTSVSSLLIEWKCEQLDDLKDEFGFTTRKVEHLSTISQHNARSKSTRHFLAKLQVFTLSMMYIFKVDANLMILGAIDFGIILDGAVIIVPEMNSIMIFSQYIGTV